MSDIVTRLFRWTHAVDAAPAGDLMDEAANEIERLREAIRRLAEQDATLSVCDGDVTVTMKARLTDAERFVLREVMDIYVGEDDVASNEIAAVIDGLLERTK